MRFNHYEKLRLDTIKAVQEERLKIVNNIIAFSDSKFSKSKFSDVNSTFQNDPRYKAIKENEKKQLDKIKQRQKMEIQTMIEFEINQEIMRKDNEEKIYRQKLKEDQMKLELFKKQKEQEEFKQKKLQEKNFMIRKEIEDQLRKSKERMIEEQKKMLDEIEKEKHKKFIQIKKAEESKMKSLSYKMQSEKLMQEQQQRLMEKQKLLEEKEKLRKELEERQRLEQQKEVERIRRDFVQRLENTRKEQENQQMQMKQDWMNKQIYNERKRMEFEKLRELALKQYKDKIIKKNEEIMNNVQKNKMEEMKKIEDYNKKMEIAEIKKFEKQNSHMLLMREKSLIKKQKEEKVNEGKMKNEIENKQKVNEILDKFNKTETKVMQTRKSFEREMMFRQEKSTMKKFKKLKIIQRLNNIAEYEKEQIVNQLREKNEKVEMLKTQKLKVNEKRKEVADQVLKQKQEVMEKFDKIMQKNKGITPEDIKILFPDDMELYQKILSIREKSIERSKYFSKMNSSNFSDQKSINKGHLRYNSLRESNPFNNSKNKNSDLFITNNLTVKDKNNALSQSTTNKKYVSAEEVKRRIDEFKLRLNQDLNKIIQEEKEKEDQRMKKYNEENDMDIKKSLELSILRERSESSRRVMLFNEEMNKKIKEFEGKIKLENNLI